MGRSKFPGKPSKIGNRKRVNLSSCALPEDNDSSKAAEKIYLGLSHFNETFGDNEMAAPGPFLGFTLREVEEAMAETRILHREAEAEHKKQGMKIDLYKDFQNELFSISNFKGTDMTNSEVNKRKLFDGGGSSKDKVKSSNDNSDNKPCSTRISNLESPIKYNSLKKQSDSVTAAKKLLEKAKSNNSDRKFILPSRSSHSSRVIKPNKRFLEDDASKHGKLLRSKNVIDGNATKKPKVMVDNKKIQELKIDVSSDENKKRLPPKTSKILDDRSKKSQESPKSTSSSGKIILREARLQLDSSNNISLMEGPFSSPNASSLSPNSQLKMNPIQSSSTPCTLVCGMCGTVRLKLREKFGILCCESCQKFISKLKRMYNAQETIQLECNTGGLCQYWSVKSVDSIKCQACWLKRCLKNSKLPWELKEKLSKLLPLSMQVSNGFDSPSILNKDISNKFVLGDNNIKDFKWFHEVSCSTSGKSVNNENETDRSKSPENSADANTRTLRRRTHSKKRTKFLNHTRKKNSRQRIDLKGPRVKHVCRSASIVLGQPLATFPGESSPTKKQSTNSDVEDCKSCDKSDTTNNCTESQGVVVDKTINNKSLVVAEAKTVNNEKKSSGKTVSNLKTALTGIINNSNNNTGSINSSNKAKKKNNISGIPENLISMDFWESYDPEEVCENGFGLIGSEPFTVRALCFLCGSSGQEKLIHCTCCCEPYHEFCINDGQIKPHDNAWKFDWVCPRCTICATCGKTSGQQLKCIKCDNSYHTECVNRVRGRLLHSPDRPWICSICLRCKSCNAVDVSVFVGNLPLCKGCFKLRKRGNFCPLCQKCYADDDFDCKMMECGECKKWVHAKCEGLSDERYQVLSDLPDDVEYICRMCCVLPPAPWWIAVEQELRSGYLDVLKSLSKNRKACTMLKWSPKKQCTCLQEEPKSVEVDIEQEEENKIKPAPITERKASFEIFNHPTESLKLTLKLSKEGEEDKKIRKSLEEDYFSNSSDSHEDRELNYKPAMTSPFNPPSDSGIGSTDDELKTNAGTDDEINKKSTIVPFLDDKQECICFLEVDTYSSRSKPFSPNLLSIKKKVTECEYSSLRQFHQDMQRMIETTQSNDLMDFYHQTLKATFPWFDPKFCIVSSQKMSPSASQESTPNATPIKSGSLKECRIPKEKLYDQPIDYYYNDYTVVDSRMCLLCKEVGDGPPNDTGRLLYCGQNEWVHCNCALWSGEVFEEIDGSLQNVHSAINRGRSIRCPECNLKGASVGCCAKNCQETYHFKCARKIGCTFMDDKYLYCPFHSNESVGKSIQNDRDFEIRRPVYVELDKRKMKSTDSKKIRFAVGGLKVESLGRFVRKLSDTREAIIPAEFQCSRWFWSCYEPWRIVRYHFTIRLMDLEKEDGIDLGLNLTIDHSLEKESVEFKMKQLRHFQQFNKFLEEKSPEKRKSRECPKPEKKPKKEHNKVVRKIFDEKEEENNLSDNQNTADLLPPDLENEILKDLPNDILDGIDMQDIFMDINKNDAFGNNEEMEEVSNDTKKIPEEFWANLSGAVEELLHKTSKRSKSEVLPKKTKNHQRSCSLNWNCKMDGNNSKWKRGQKYNVTVNLLEPQGDMLQEIKFADGSVKELTRRLVQDEGKENKCLPWHTVRSRLLQVDGGVDSSSSGSEAGESPQRLIDLPSSQSQNYFVDNSKPTTSYHPVPPDNYFCDSPLPQIDGNNDSDVDDRLSNYKINQLDGTVDSDNEDDLPLPCNITTDEKPVACSRCKSTYRTKLSYQRHLDDCRNMFSSSEGESEEEKASENEREVPVKLPTPPKSISPPKIESPKEKPRPSRTYAKRKPVQRNSPIIKNSAPVPQIVLQQPPALIVRDLAPPVVPTTYLEPNPIQYVVDPQHHIIAAPGPLPGTYQLQSAPEPQYILPQNQIQPGIIIQPTITPSQQQIVVANDPNVLLGSTPMFGFIRNPQTGEMYLASHSQPVFYNTETIVSNTVMQTNQFISHAMATSSFSQSTQVFQTSKVEQVVNVQPSNYVIVNQDSKIMTSNDIICLNPMMSNQQIQMTNQSPQLMQQGRFSHPEQKIAPQMTALRCIRPQQQKVQMMAATPVRPIQTRPVVRSSPMMRPNVTKIVSKTYEKAVITPKATPRPHQTSRALIDFINNFKSDDYQLPPQPEPQETTIPPPVVMKSPEKFLPQTERKPPEVKQPIPTEKSPTVLIKQEWETPKLSPRPVKPPEPKISIHMPSLDDEPPLPEQIKIEILPLQDNFQAININVPKKLSQDVEKVKNESEENDLLSKSIAISPRLVQPAPKKDVPIENFMCEVKQDDKGPKLVVDAKSDDGFEITSSTIKEVWEKICSSAQKMRSALKLPQLPVSRKGHEFLGMENHGLQFLLEQLRGAEHSVVYKHRRYIPKQTSQKPDEESLVKENPSGCARSEKYAKRKEYDMFAWLASKYRELPKLRISDEALSSICGKRANNLPLAMQYRYLKDTWKFYVGVYKSKIHGRGLFCLREIEAGEMVIEYAGELIRSNVTDKREKFYTDKGIGCCYMFRIDDHFVVDATMKGNAARFINHSCEPNCYSRVVDILGKKHIVIFALRKINVMEELTYDYKFPFEDEKISCHCTSKKCRKYLN